MKDEVLEAYGRKMLEEYRYWVYVLECHDRFYCDTYAELADKAETRIGWEPKWLRMAWEADVCKYVGQTENLEKRLGQHFKDKNSSDFTTIFEPKDVVYLKPAWSRNHAERMEERIGKSYYDDDRVYAYWN